MLRKSDLHKYMDVIFSAQDVENPKPESDMYDEAILSLGLMPKECLIVEDNENGIAAARKSGAHVLIVDEVDEVNLDNIKDKIKRIESEGG
jgi:HAD superfamily hydrolase (TIGR01509 family)